MIASAIVFVLAVALAWWLIVPQLIGWIELIPVVSAWSAGLGNLLFAFVLILFSGTLYLTLAGLLSSLLWDRLSVEVEREAGFVPAQTKVGCATTVGDTVVRGLFSFFIAVAAFGCGWLCFGVIALGLAGWLGLYDYSASAFLRRGVSFPGQFVRAPGLPGALGFALVSGLLTLIPLLNVLSLPALVAGGTLLVAESEKSLAKP
jgi:uncharacterized protein involved in cysteine biosynthesis